MGPLQNAIFGHEIVDTEVIRQLLYGLAMVLIMLYRSEGLWPSPKHEDKIAKLAKRAARSRCAPEALTEWRTCHNERINNIRLSVKGVNKRFGGLQALSDVGLRNQGGPDLRPDRPERRRQDHVLQRDHGPVHAGFRRIQARRRELHADRRVSGGEGGHCAHVPEHPSVRWHDRAGKRDGRPPRAHEARPDRRGVPDAVRASRKSARSRNARSNCWNTSALRSTRTTRRAICRTATSVVWKSPAHWQRIRSCSRSTNRLPA